MTGADGNSRVTLAILGQKIDHLTEKVETAIQDGKAREKRLRDVETNQASLKATVRNWNGLNSLGVIVASVLGALGIKQ